MSDSEGEPDDWDLLTYHDNIRDAYKILQACLPLGPFRKPSRTEPTHIKQIFQDLRSFMKGYATQFIDFADNERLAPSGIYPSSGDNPKKLKKTIDPLLRFSLKLKDALKQAEKDAGEDGWSLEVDSDFDINLSSSQLREADAKAERILNTDHQSYSPPPPPPPPAEPTTALNKRDRGNLSPSKRPSNIFETATAAKRARAPSIPSAPVVSNPFRAEPRIFSRTESGSSTSTTISTSSTSTSVSNTTITTPWPSNGDIGSIARSFVRRDKSLARPPSPEKSTSPSINVTPCPYQTVLTKRNINFYVQWELYRRISEHELVDWNDIEVSDVARLEGNATDAEPRIREMLDQVVKRQTNLSNKSAMTDQHLADKIPQAPTKRRARLLAEVDNEEQSILAGDLRGCGNDHPDWRYGGKIMYTISIQPTEDKSEYMKADGLALDSSFYASFSHLASKQSGPVDVPDSPFSPSKGEGYPFKMTLRPPDMPGKSHRLARRFGSRRIISFKIKDVPSHQRKSLRDMIVGKIFVILGRPYRGFWAPADGQGIFAIETNEMVMGVFRNSRLDEPEMPSFLELFERYNDLRQKPNQAMAKWAARPQILFSDSVPAATVFPSAIQVVPDIVTIEAQIDGKATTEQTLTDGCGLMSESLAQRIYRCPHLQFTNGRPTVLQIRLGGSKGLLALMSPSQMLEYPGKEVVLRESMVKALSAPVYREDISLLTIDIVRCESLKIGAALSAEAIIAMHHNGVPTSTFVEMAEKGLNTLRDAFLPQPLDGETEENTLERIMANCHRQGGVGMERKKRAVKAEGRSAKVAGCVKKWSDEEIEDLSNDILTVGPGERYDVDPISGQPGSIAEALYEAVGSGFHPAHSGYTAAKLHHLVDTLSTKTIREFKIPVDQSLTAFIIPDSLEILKPHEVFVAFSAFGPIDPTTHRPMSHLEGDLIGYRSPCKVPTDVRKLTAVYKPELAHLKDCIVLSASSDLCHRSPASYMGGGDYDGDTLTLFWGHELVKNFKNAPDRFAITPAGFEEQNFDKEVVQGTQFLKELDGLTEEEKVAKMQYWLLGAVTGDELTGKYSDLHGNAVYKLGYDHPDTLRLAQMFCHVLDARKSGLRVKDGILKLDMRKYGGEVDWRRWKKGEEAGRGTNNAISVVRPRRLGPFIMDTLMEAGKAKKVAVMGSFLREPQPPSSQDYDDLVEIWRNLRSEDQAKSALVPAGEPAGREQELDAIEKHVKACYEISKLIATHRCEVFSRYDQLMSDDGNVSMIPRKRKVVDHPSRGGSPTKRRKNKTSEDNLDTLTKFRQLAFIFQNKLDLASLPQCKRYWDEERLRKVKLSCLVHRSQHKTRPVILPFKLDFTGIRQMKVAARARARGEPTTGTATYLKHIADSMKPNYRAPGES